MHFPPEPALDAAFRGMKSGIQAPGRGVCYCTLCEKPANPALGACFERFYANATPSSRSCLSASSLPTSSNEFVIAAFPFSTLVIT